MENEVLQRLKDVENRYKNMKRLFFGGVGIMLVALFCFGFTKAEKFDVITVKGIIVKDENGKDRILIGSPIPFSKDRVRTDTALVRKHWANKFNDPNQYMEWYRRYRNSANGIVFMNQEGFDEVLVGENLADANVGVRLFRMSGILVNTQKGWERVGAGVNTLENGETRQGFGVDDDSGEALHMMTMEDGSKGIVIGGESGSFRIGMAKKDGELFQNKGKFTGIKYFDNNGNLIWEQNIDSVPKKKK